MGSPALFIALGSCLCPTAFNSTGNSNAYRSRMWTVTMPWTQQRPHLLSFCPAGSYLSQGKTFQL